jgi:hypothetical protein
MNNPVKIYTARDPLQIEGIRSIMDEQNIEIFLFEKTDTAYPWLGETQVFCQPADVLKAIHLLKENGYE